MIFIAISSAMDSFSVSIARGFANTHDNTLAEALKVGVFFWIFPSNDANHRVGSWSKYNRSNC